MARNIVGGKIRIDQLVDTVIRELDDYSQYVSGTAIKNAVKKTSEEAVKELRANSPGSGSYSHGWTNDESGRPKRYQYAEIVYNNEYQLTHLLEKGHRIKNQVKTYPGRVAAIPHIAPVEEKLEEWLIKYLKGELEG